MKYPGWLTWLLLFFPLAACCQWDYVNPVATADNYTSLYFTDPATGFALTTHGTLMGTVDGGNSWTKIGNVFPSSVFFLDMTFTSPLEGTLTGGLGVILHTRNGGHAWDSVPSGTEANLQAVYMYSDSVGYIAGLHGTVLKTLNGGRSWTLVQTNLDRDLYDCWFVGPSTGFVAADKSVFRTLDGGTTWNQVLLADSGANFIRIAFADSLHGFT
ncbi:MAG: YCF48-related protein, partial [Bacteroidota bacterium]